jgi:hypothetical protein
MKGRKCYKKQLVPKYMPIKDAAYYFGFAEQTIRNWISQNKLLRNQHYIKADRSIRIIVEKFDQYLIEKSNPLIPVGGK